MKRILLIISICVFAFFACKKDIELLYETIPEVVTGKLLVITDSSAVLSFNLKTKGSASVMYGFYYCEAPNNSPTAMDKVVTLSIQDKQSFSYTLTGLKENTTYYVRAYARNRLGEAQGEIVQFTTLSKNLPRMGNSSVTNVTSNSAKLIGNVVSAGTGTVKERGFCLSTTETPTIADSCITVGLGTGSFNYTLTELEDGVTFYVRAYATSGVGTAYGETMSFTTASEQLPIVVTKSVTEITPWYATLNGELESEGTSSVTEMGFCYSATTQTPTLLDEYVKVNGSSFASVITTLSEGTTYYVRAYATNSKGTAYGDVISFTTNTIKGAIQAAFSVSDTKKVYFSKGNLQYQASTNTWRFAEHQYDKIGNDNANISSTYSGWIDLFGWGTSGWNSGAKAFLPSSTSLDDSDYYPGGSYTKNLTDNYANADWGVYNKLSNGGNLAGQWRTLTSTEWNYVISQRSNAGSLHGAAIVNGVNGLVLLPDNWSFPDNVHFSYGEEGWSQNIYSVSDWCKMEGYGAVFLPAVGYRVGTDVYYVGEYGYYWSSSYYSNNSAFGAYFHDYYIDARSLCYRHGGLSVRLVQDVKN